MATAQQIHDNLPLSTNVTSTADTIKALNAAIDESWPRWKLEETLASAATLLSGTYSYVISTAIPYELGGWECLLHHNTGEPPMLARDLRMTYDQSGSAWTLIVSPAVVESWADCAVDLHYQYKHPRISAITDTVYLPNAYASRAVVQWYAMRKLSEEHTDQRPYWSQMLQANGDPQDVLPFIPSIPTRRTVGKDRMTV